MDDFTQLRLHYQEAREQYKRSYIAATKEFGEEITHFLIEYDAIVQRAQEKYLNCLQRVKDSEKRKKLRALKDKIGEVAFNRLLDLSRPAQLRLDEKIKEAQKKLKEIEEILELGEEIEI